MLGLKKRETCKITLQRRIHSCSRTEEKRSKACKMWRPMYFQIILHLKLKVAPIHELQTLNSTWRSSSKDYWLSNSWVPYVIELSLGCDIVLKSILCDTLRMFGLFGQYISRKICMLPATVCDLVSSQQEKEKEKKRKQHKSMQIFVFAFHYNYR